MTISAWKIRTVMLLVTFGMLSLGGRAASTKGYTFTSFDYPGTNSTSPGGINNRGQVVGTVNDVPEASAGFLYRDGEFSKIMVPGSAKTFAAGINDQGQIVGSAFVQGVWFAYLYLYRSESNFFLLNVPGASATFANGTNNWGQIVGYYNDANGTHGFLYDNGSFLPINRDGATLISLNGINDRGQIVGSYVLGGTQYGFLYDNKVFTQLRFPGSTMTLAEGINNRGQIVGTYYDAVGTHGFVYEDGSYQSFVVPESVYTVNSQQKTGTFAAGINDRSEISGIWWNQDSVKHGFIATPHSAGKNGGY